VGTGFETGVPLEPPPHATSAATPQTMVSAAAAVARVKDRERPLSAGDDM
jgi:hypothetical protein